jgi:hypothetical protein
LTRVVESIIAEDSGVPLLRRIAVLEEDKNMLQRAVDHGIEDYYPLVMGNKSLLSERNELKCHYKDLQATPVEAHSNAKKSAANLEAKVKAVKAHDERRLRDFEDGLVQKLVELHGLYARNVQTIGGLCS